MNLTDKERRTLNAIREFIETHGYSPTLHEIAGIRASHGDGATRQSAALSLLQLRNKGLVTWTVGKHRSLRCTDSVR